MPEILALTDPDRAHWTEPGAPRPVRTTLWRPAAPGPAPLVLLSHGTGGRAETLGWLAEALTGAGYAVAGVDHHGNTSVEPYVAECFVYFWERPRDFTVVLDALADDPGLDLGRVGAAGFSLGGYTVAGLLGARIAPRRLRQLLDEPAQAPLPEYPNLSEELLARYGAARSYAISMSACRVDVADARVRCGFLMAPMMGMICDPASLARITAPVHIVWAENDAHAPAPRNAFLFRDHVPGATAHGLPRTTHYDFLRRPRTQAETARQALAFFARALPVEDGATSSG